MKKHITITFFVAVMAGCGIKLLDHDGVAIPSLGESAAFEPEVNMGQSPATGSGGSNTGSGTSSGGNSSGTGTPTPANPNIVTFAIPLGQAAAPWGSAANPIRGRVGQTLRITNNDSEVHRIHTGGSPFPHTNNIAPGATADFPLNSAITNLPTTPSLAQIYEHNKGSSAVIYMVITP